MYTDWTSERSATQRIQTELGYLPADERNATGRAGHSQTNMHNRCTGRSCTADRGNTTNAAGYNQPTQRDRWTRAGREMTALFPCLIAADGCGETAG